MGGQGPVGEVVLGTRDLVATTAFLGEFGLREVEQVVFEAEESHSLHGAVGGRSTAVRLAAAGSPDRATVLLVPTAGASTPLTGWAHGPRALDLYTTDLDRSVADLTASGYHASPEAVLAGGPMRMRQVLVRGPDELPVVVVESTHRRSSVCDLPDGRLHSEPHSIVWCVENHAAELAQWVAAGWTAGTTIAFSEPSVSDELGLDERPTPITMTMLSDEAVAPIRLELLTFDDHGSDGRPSPVEDPVAMTTGLHALTVPVSSIDEAVSVWGSGARFGARVVLRGGGRAVAGVTVGGVRMILTEAG